MVNRSLTSTSGYAASPSRCILQVLNPKLRLRMETLKNDMQWTDLV